MLDHGGCVHGGHIGPHLLHVTLLFAYQYLLDEMLPQAPKAICHTSPGPKQT